MSDDAETAPAPLPDGTAVNVTLRLEDYPLEAIMASGYQLIDRCYVFLAPAGAGAVRVSLTPKAGARAAAAARFEEELRTELADQVLRLQLARSHEPVREELLGRALFGVGAELDEELAADDTLDRFDEELAGASDLPEEDDDYLDDPLGIAVPWEEKFAAGAASAEATPAGADARDGDPSSDEPGGER